MSDKSLRCHITAVEADQIGMLGLFVSIWPTEKVIPWANYFIEKIILFSALEPYYVKVNSAE